MAAALVITNLVDATATVLSASNAVVGGPPSNLREEHVGRKWRDNAATTFVLADLGSLQTIDTVALLGVSSLGSSFSFQLRLSSVDATGAAGDIFNSGALTTSQYFSANYQTFGFLMTTPGNARYVRIDISQPTAPYIEAGRWLIGLRQEFSTNFQTPWTRSARRNSVDAIGVGGQTFVDRRPGYWLIDAQFGFLTESERDALIETIGIAVVNSGHKDILWINDTASVEYSRDFVWGYVDGELRLTQNIYIIPPLYGVDFSIRQRL